MFTFSRLGNAINVIHFDLLLFHLIYYSVSTRKRKSIGIGNSTLIMESKKVARVPYKCLVHKISIPKLCKGRQPSDGLRKALALAYKSSQKVS